MDPLQAVLNGLHVVLCRAKRSARWWFRQACGVTRAVAARFYRQRAHNTRLKEVVVGNSFLSPRLLRPIRAAL